MPTKTKIKSNINISREARMLFREKRYKKLVKLLENVERNGYLESLYHRAKNSDKYNPRRIVKGQADQKKEEETEEEEKKEKKGLLKKSLSWLKDKGQVIKRKRTQMLLAQNLEKQALLKKKGLKDKQSVMDELEDNEMEIARNVQANLLPKINNDILPGLDTYVQTLSASELSGDVYDFIEHNKYESVFYIGDVTGHGAGAGLVMTMISTLTYSIAKKTSHTAKVLATLNKEIKPKLAKKMFATMIMCRWNNALKKFYYSGAGHEYILHFHQDTKKIEKIKTGGIAIGMIPDVSKIIKEKEITLNYGDLLMMYTDGITEAWDTKGKEMYSLDQIVNDLVLSAVLNKAGDVGQMIFKRVRKFQGDKDRTDDITLMVFRRVKGENEEAEKQAYEKAMLELDVLKKEALLQSGDEGFNPDIKKNKEALVKKLKRLALIYLDEEKYYEAKDCVQKGLRIDPENKELKQLIKEIEKNIEISKQESLLNNLKHAVKSSLKRMIQKAFNPKKDYLKSLSKDLKKALGVKDFDSAKQILENLKKLNPDKSLVEKLTAQMEQAKKNNDALAKFFDLSVKKDDEKKTEEEEKEEKISISSEEQKQKDEMEKKKMESMLGKKDFKISFNTGGGGDEDGLGKKGGGKEDSEEKKRDINKDYKTEDLFKLKDDVFGLQSLMKKVKKSTTSLEKEMYKNKKEAAKKAEEEERRKKSIEWAKSTGMKKIEKKYSKFMATISPMNRKDLFTFIEKLSAFIKAGIPIQKSVEIILLQAKNDGFIYVLIGILDLLNSGKMLSQALKQFPKQFPEMLIYLVHAGEKSGTLPTILSDLAEQMKEQLLVKSKIKSAMMYPSIVLTAGIFTIVGMMVFIIPKLMKVYGDTGVDLPKITQMIVSMSNFIRTKYVILIVSIVSFFGSIIYFGKTKLGRSIYDFMYLYIPIVKNITKENNNMLFAINLGVLLENNIQISEALDVVAKIVTNTYFKKEIIKSREKMILGGIPLSEALGINDTKKSNLFTMEILQSINIGEQTGHLGHMMKSAGEMCKEQVRNTVKGLSDIIEPILIMCLGLMVTVIIVSIMFPLFQLGKVMRKQ